MGKQEVFCRDGLRPKSHASLLYSIQKTVCEASSMSKFIVLNTIQKTVGDMYPDDLLLPPEFCSSHLSHDATGEDSLNSKSGDSALSTRFTDGRGVEWHL